MRWNWEVIVLFLCRLSPALQQDAEKYWNLLALDLSELLFAADSSAYELKQPGLIPESGLLYPEYDLRIIILKPVPTGQHTESNDFEIPVFEAHPVLTV